MMDVRIYQIDHERDSQRVSFCGMDSLEKFTGSRDVDSSIYDCVYEGTLPCDTLDEVYEKLNLDHPEGYHGHSLSVSDVVEICDKEDDPLHGFHFVDSVGFVKIDFAVDAQRAPDKLKVLLVQPGKYPRLVEMEDSLEAMQQMVGGDIEEYMPFEDDVAIICNEEGKVNGLPLNRAIYGGETHEMMDIIAGTFFIAYAPVESEKFKSLPPKMADKYAQRFKYPETFMKVGGEIKAISVKPPKNKER